MRRGQAFDTFKLMIAAVVAVAILGILMGILSQLSLPTGNPQSVFQGLMSYCAQNPGAIKTSDTVNFKGNSGDAIALGNAMRSGGITSVTSFDCTASAYATLITCAGNQDTDPLITFREAANFQATFRVTCGSSATSATPRGTVMIEIAPPL